MLQNVNLKKAFDGIFKMYNIKAKIKWDKVLRIFKFIV
jgi:hypothetical protein